MSSILRRVADEAFRVGPIIGRGMVERTIIPVAPMVTNAVYEAGGFRPGHRREKVALAISEGRAGVDWQSGPLDVLFPFGMGRKNFLNLGDKCNIVH